MIGNACYQKEDVSALNCVAADQITRMKIQYSYIHIVFTYRALAAAVCAWSGMCMVKMEFVFYR